MSAEPEVMDASRCWDHLRSTEVGRVAAVVHGAPVIRPVNFAVDRGTLLIRTGHGSMISTLTGGLVVLEADGTEHTGGEGEQRVAWSVIVDGTLHGVRTSDELLDTFGVPLFPWHASPKPMFLRLEPVTISGRRFTVVEASAWRTAYDDTPRATPE